MKLKRSVTRQALFAKVCVGRLFLPLGVEASIWIIFSDWLQSEAE